MFRSKADLSSPLRFFVYVSEQKLQMFLDQIDEPVRRSIAAELKVDLKLVSLKLNSSAIDQSQWERGRLAKLAVVEDVIARHHNVEGLAAKRGYFAASVEMDWMPCDDNETVLFCGYHGSLLVVLGGSVSNLWGRPTSSGQLGSHPYTIKAAIRRGGQMADPGADLEAAAAAICCTPQPVRFLARAISRGPLPRGDAEYLLGTPLFVEASDTEAAGLR